MYYSIATADMNPHITLTALLLFLYTSVAYTGNEIRLELPPDSLEQWYKPSNKRQVWLHNMFKLRREMQAIDEYSRAGNYQRIDKWLTRFTTHYNKIGEMVPEWKNRIKPRLLTELTGSLQQQDSIKIKSTLNSLRRTCNNCHKEYQPLVMSLYRTPDYDDIEITDDKGHKQSMEDNMTHLSRSLNQILIALDDNEIERALDARMRLISHLEQLGESCTSCHKDDPYPKERILGKTTHELLSTLKGHIEQTRIKDSKQLMGKIAVSVCSRCHNTHRTLYELRHSLSPEH